MTAATTAPIPQNFNSSGLRQKVDQLMDSLYSGGVSSGAAASAAHFVASG